MTFLGLFAKPTPDQKQDILIYKWIAFAGIFLITLTFALLPVLWKKFRSSEAILGMANSFSGGLFLAAGVVHILPETAEPFKDKFPLPFAAAIGSYS